mmetsp:Transcript_44877/g.85794  ORF Transcript_44877/g.85794 Transcript_44877/m.85794 type:complete len:141 (+) Transcript_44877:541-963(+)
MSLFGLGRNARTFRPKKAAPAGSKGAQLRKHIDATLGSGNLREAVALPPGEDLSEWLAVNTVDFYNAVNLLYNTLAEFCTAETCATMSAGPKYEYRWADGVKVRGERARDEPPTTTARRTEPGRVRGRLIHLRRRAKFDC